jgi:hypothetical protein
MSLSVCCITANPAGAATVLTHVRQVADEIVVAVDDWGGKWDLRALAAIADRLFEISLDGFEFPEPAMDWIHAQCSADWILRLDDDELPSASLLEQLPSLTAARDVTQYWLARRWLYPDASHWLDDWPWFPDFQPRLIRNDALKSFPGLFHSGFEFSMPARFLDAGLYHLLCVLADRPARVRRVERYLAIEPRLRVTDTEPDVQTYYLPELHPTPRLASVDPRDEGAIAAALRRPRGTRRGPLQRAKVRAGLGPAKRVPDREVRARWGARELDESAYRATIWPLDVYRKLVAGDIAEFLIGLRNEGSEWWPGGAGREPLLRVSYHWLSPEGKMLEFDGYRTALREPLAPGESCVTVMNVLAPLLPGSYLLVPDLVHEQARWFGCETAPLQMQVTAPDSQPR